MKYIKIAIIALILFPYLSHSEEYLYKHAIPSRSPLTPTQCEFGGPTVCFSGEVPVTAKYRFSYDYDGSTGFSDNPYMLIYPDKSSLELLPYLTHLANEEKPSEIMIDNPSEVAFMLFGAQLSEKISSGSFLEISGEAEFIIYRFGASYECDAPFFFATIRSIKKVVTPHKFSENKKKIKSEKKC